MDRLNQEVIGGKCPKHSRHDPGSETANPRTEHDRAEEEGVRGSSAPRPLADQRQAQRQRGQQARDRIATQRRQALQHGPPSQTAPAETAADLPFTSDPCYLRIRRDANDADGRYVSLSSPSLLPSSARRPAASGGTTSSTTRS